MPVLTLPRADALSVRAKALVFNDPKSVELLRRIQQVARSQATVLVQGETGTGKEIVARHVHALSPRADRPFVAVNCGALSDSLVESELFGHERGAFTGAAEARAGWFETAHGGTLFLDEIGDLSLSAQVKLLRVLQEGEVVRLGSRKTLQVDVRLIAATNVGLEAAVAAGRFRQDLYYRLHVAALALPPLRERPDDVLPLAQHFIDQYTSRMGLGEVALGPDAIQGLLQHAWPGNIRELENVIHHALVVCQNRRISLADLRLTSPLIHARAEVRAGEPRPSDPAAPSVPALERALLDLFEQNVPDLYQHLEERIVRAAYRFCDNNQLQTARLLGVSRNVVRARLIQYGDVAGSLRTSSDRPSSIPPPPSAAPVPAVVRVGYQRFGRLPLLKASGALDRALESIGARVEWREYPGGTQLVEAFEADELAFGMVGDGPSVLALAGRVPVVYLAAEPLAPEGEAIVVPSGSEIRSIEDLRGRTIMVNRGANAHYFLIRALEQAHIDQSDVQIAYVPPDRAEEAFREADVDAWATWEPFIGAAQREGRARVLCDGRGFGDRAAYYIARRSFSAQYPEVVSAFLRELKAIIPGPRGPLPVDGTPRGPMPLNERHIERLQAVADAFLRHDLIDRPVAISEACWQQA